jgi:HK97 gp10 family phage protein
MAAVSLKMEGYEEFKKQLEQLAREDIKNAAYSGAAGGAKLVRDTAKQNVISLKLYETGALYRAIVFKREREQGLSGVISYIIAVRHGRSRTGKQRKIGDDPFYWMFWEFGTRTNPRKSFLVPALANNITGTAEKVRANMARRLRRNKLIK